MATKIKVRDLTVKDRIKLADLIISVVAKTGDESLLKMFVSSKEKGSGEGLNKENYAAIGVRVFLSLLQNLEEETRAWFADLVGLTVEEFYTLPFSTELVILDQITSKEDFDTFFNAASALFKKMSKFKNMLSEAKKG